MTRAIDTPTSTNPPLVDVEIIFAQVIAHMSDEA